MKIFVYLSYSDIVDNLISYETHVFGQLFQIGTVGYHLILDDII